MLWKSCVVCLLSILVKSRWYASVNARTHAKAIPRLSGDNVSQYTHNGLIAGSRWPPPRMHCATAIQRDERWQEIQKLYAGFGVLSGTSLAWCSVGVFE
jgi:hypothetical protein